MEFWRRKKEKETVRSFLSLTTAMEFWRRKSKERKCFLKNGSMFLEKLIADCNGISNPIRMFSSHQISKATNHFDPNYLHPELASLTSYWGFTFYKGVIDSRSYTIKKFSESWSKDEEEEERIYNDIVLSARVSNHNGFLKLMGCCLEFPLPVMVFEDLEYKAMNHLGNVGSLDGPVLPWNVRLKIGREVAIAITYLHTAFPRIIIHRDIKPKENIMGTYGYVDPFYMATGFLTASSDVFSFGILMLVLLIGKPAVLDKSYGELDFGNRILDYVKDLQQRGEPIEFGGDSNDMRPGQMKMFLDLALRCCEERNEDRPKMILVAKQIKLIEQASL
ncbi:unnamed protein product [Eruca vesicaria subsp. sativa]|uniref:Protein kinase domain-containing protein n=1 Tax=Eruca vesicaria subsp. sativa TaxID=29727 RepID=A0ABC8JKT4_ERUVS|nr:unnamed protein product [Eruca vesicaria subsp. sativa]